MTRFEKILIGLGLASLLAVLMFRHGGNLAAVPAGYTPDPIGGDLVGDSPLPSVSGPAYLTFNRPYMTVPPYAMTLPEKTAAPAALYGTPCTGGC